MSKIRRIPHWGPVQMAPEVFHSRHLSLFFADVISDIVLFKNKYDSVIVFLCNKGLKCAIKIR